MKLQMLEGKFSDWEGRPNEIYRCRNIAAKKELVKQLNKRSVVDVNSKPVIQS